MKTREDLIDLIDQLNVTVRSLEDDYHVDDGGCVWVSYLIAREFDRRNISYKVVIYVLPDEHSKDVRTICRNQNLCHMAISVLNQEIGGPISSEMMDEHGITKFTIRMTPDEILKIYEDFEFNGGFDRQYVEIVEDEIKMTFQMCW